VSTPLPAKRTWSTFLCGAVLTLMPGLAITFSMALTAVLGGKLFYGSGASPLMLAILLGIIARTIIGAPVMIGPGVLFAQKGLLRLAIILLGVQLTFADLTSLSASILGVILATVVCTFIFCSWAGSLLGVDSALIRLIAAGAAICGISAIVVTNTVAEAPEEDVTYAVATATAFGSISIFAYPVLAAILSLQPTPYAVWVGSSLHEVAQVTAAGFVYGNEAGELAVLVKLTRVLLLLPMVLALAWLYRPKSRGDAVAKSSLTETIRKFPFPFFILGFVLMIGVNSLELVPLSTKASLTFISAFLFAMALAALGLETDLKKLRQRGLRPLLAGILAWVFISAFSFGLVQLLVAPHHI
jgi:uncharacterized integral membrane protein (TIGR00698 family)